MLIEVLAFFGLTVMWTSGLFLGYQYLLDFVLECFYCDGFRRYFRLGVFLLVSFAMLYMIDCSIQITLKYFQSLDKKVTFIVDPPSMEVERR